MSRCSGVEREFVAGLYMGTSSVVVGSEVLSCQSHSMSVGRLMVCAGPVKLIV